MQIQSQIVTLTKNTIKTLVVGLNTAKPLSETLDTLDKASGGFFTQQLEAGTLPEKTGEIRTFYQVPGVDNQTIVVVAFDRTQKGLVAASKKIVGYLRSHRIDNAHIALLLNDFGLSKKKAARLISQTFIDADYVFESFKSKVEEKTPLTICLVLEQTDKKVETGILEGLAIGYGMNILKDLGNIPSNVCTPKYLAGYAKKLAKKHNNLSTQILKKEAIKKLKMGALLSVSKGSKQKPRLIQLTYRGAQNKKSNPIVLVGKGVTFDTGGISLKPGASMDEMKYDMCGAGSVIGAIKAIAMLNLPINVIGIVPAVENMPSGHASKPGDIVTSMSGKTIEILNTDAEGRLILCDALTYAQRFNPKAIIDIATLTGAVIIGLGRQPSGLMSNNEALANALIDAGEASGDRVWQLPLWEEYLEQLQSPFADLQNIGGRDAGTITAGCFLGEFAKDVAWAHLDIAGTAWRSGKNKGATGRPVPLLVEYLMSQVD